MRIRFTQTLRPNISTGVTSIQPVQSLGEHFESTHTSTGAILVDDLHDTSNKDSPAKPPNISIPLLTPPPISTIVTGKPGHLPSTERQSTQELSAHLRRDIIQALENAHQKEISTLKATCQKYKMALDGEIGTNVEPHARVQNLEDELNASKYMQEQALQAQKSARAELLEVKKELRMLQVLHQEVDEGNAANDP
ncbi:hypothetical protein R1flu_012728 [Riccia fluitans]|uniref:Uncharacterized protein n=1 Tax=Riccia fluitans TaxID=41844 RepID=A0ABD1ZBG3_9MARC